MKGWKVSRESNINDMLSLHFSTYVVRLLSLLMFPSVLCTKLPTSTVNRSLLPVFNCLLITVRRPPSVLPLLVISLNDVYVECMMKRDTWIYLEYIRIKENKAGMAIRNRFLYTWPPVYSLPRERKRVELVSQYQILPKGGEGVLKKFYINS